MNDACSSSSSPSLNHTTQPAPKLPTMEKGKKPDNPDTATASSSSANPTPAPVPAPSTIQLWGGMDAADENTLPMLTSVPGDHLRIPRTVCSAEDYLPYHDSPVLAHHPDAATDCFLVSLPIELLDAVLSYLSPYDLASVGQTCRLLQERATSDFHWQALVQAHVPGNTVTSSYPCTSFRDLWISQDPRWFLPKYKIWFSGQDLMGKLIIVRYDQRRGCIEGYQLLAISHKTEYQRWMADQEVIIHRFEPEVKLHLDKPVLHLRSEGNDSHEWQWGEKSAEEGMEADQDHIWDDLEDGIPRYSHSIKVIHLNQHESAPAVPSKPNRFAAEIPMGTDNDGNDGMFSNFMHARPLHKSDADLATSMDFPYGDMWPPPPVPARHRVAASNFLRVASRRFRKSRRGPADRPRRRAHVSDQTFHIRSWMEMRHSAGSDWSSLNRSAQVGEFTHAPVVNHQAGPSVHGPRPGAAGGPSSAATAATAQAFQQGGSRAEIFPTFRTHIGEEVTTYSTLDPSLYTPTADAPWRGIWVGDYSGHGCEFLLVNQVFDDNEDPSENISREEGETDDDLEKRRHNARVHRGRLEAIKLTGDANVPRGELTFVAEDLGPDGFVNVIQEEPFQGVRVVKSKGHVAQSGFQSDKFIESQLLLISHDRLAQYWVGFGHISYFERVDIDKFLAF